MTPVELRSILILPLTPLPFWITNVGVVVIISRPIKLSPLFARIPEATPDIPPACSVEPSPNVLYISVKLALIFSAASKRLSPSSVPGSRLSIICLATLFSDEFTITSYRKKDINTHNYSNHERVHSPELDSPSLITRLISRLIRLVLAMYRQSTAPLGHST